MAGLLRLEVPPEPIGDATASQTEIKQELKFFHMLSSRPAGACADSGIYSWPVCRFPLLVFAHDRLVAQLGFVARGGFNECARDSLNRGCVAALRRIFTSQRPGW